MVCGEVLALVESPPAWSEEVCCRAVQHGKHSSLATPSFLTPVGMHAQLVFTCFKCSHTWVLMQVPSVKSMICTLSASDSFSMQMATSGPASAQTHELAPSGSLFFLLVSVPA